MRDTGDSLFIRVPMRHSVIAYFQVVRRMYSRIPTWSFRFEDIDLKLNWARIAIKNSEIAREAIEVSFINIFQFSLP